ncbi:MAG TPA: DUF6624 domain-containing protein [Planctomycetota bacterium]|nr:DUF6624 domain-containing protein [Planctomycetota bacterium]
MPPRDDDLRSELLAMAKVDQESRHADAATQRAMGDVDARHTARLRAIVDRCGWPDASLVGEDGSFAAWLLVQHADGDPAFQERCLALMTAAPTGTVAKRNIAYLTDRVRVALGRPQVYGTQLNHRIEDPSQVDERRREAGMETLAEYHRFCAEAEGRRRAAASGASVRRSPSEN